MPNVRRGRLASPWAAAPFYLCYLLPALTLVSVRAHVASHVAGDAAAADAWAGNTWNTAWFVFAVMPLLEILVPDDVENPTEEEERDAARDVMYKLPLWLWPIAQTLCVVCGAWAFVNLPLSLHQAIGLVVSTGTCTGGVGIAVAHELLHKGTRGYEAFAAKYLLALVCYVHFVSSHRFGHHVNVATPRDPSSAPRGMSFYAFFPRAVVGGYRDAWRIHASGDARDALGVGFLATAHVAPAGVAVALVFWTGSLAALAFFVLQAFQAVVLLELVNYVEHYGLRREWLPEKGTYERVDVRHSWNAPQRVTNWFVFRLQRHSDHHVRATTPYQALRSFPDSPTLPTGYTGTMLCALVPAWFEHSLAPVLDTRDGEKKEAARTESITAVEKRAGSHGTAPGEGGWEAANQTAKERMTIGVLVATILVTCLVCWPR